MTTRQAETAVAVPTRFLVTDGALAGSQVGISTPAQARTALNVEDGATADQTNAEIKTAYEANADTNAFLDAEKTKLTGIAESANNYAHPNHTGDVTSTADGATAIANAAVTNAKLANMDAGYVKMRTTAGAGAPEDIEIADNAAVRSAATGRPLVAANIEAASAIVTLTEAAIVTDPDWDSFINGEVTLTANRVMDLFENGQPGTWRFIEVIQGGAGSFTLTFAAGYHFVGKAAPTLSTAVGAGDVLSIRCKTTGVFQVFTGLDVGAPA